MYRLPTVVFSWAVQFGLLFFLSNCSCSLAEQSSFPVLTPQQQAAIEQAKLDPDQIAPLLEKPLYEFSEAEVDRYLNYLQLVEPDLKRRVVHLARKNLGQPYELYLLGEMPFEHYDPQPIYCLEKSDCLVYSEHTYAMALANDWPSFMGLLQRIRYRDGQIGVATRNHYTEADWNPSNRWLVRDITAEVGGEKVLRYRQRIDRAKFLKKRYQLQVDIPVETHEDVFLSIDDVDLAKPHLQEGDFVNIVRGRAGANGSDTSAVHTNAWVGHVGLIVYGQDERGKRQINLIHSTKPRVREESLDQYIARSNENLEQLQAGGKPQLLGFKFLRLVEDPLAKLKESDGPDAPRVTLPKGSRASFP